MDEGDMDSHIRYIGVDGHRSWKSKAAALQQQYYEERNGSWTCCKGKREILEEEIKILFVDSEEVKTVMDAIYKEAYGFIKFSMQSLRPFDEILGGRINLPVFPVNEIQGGSINFPVFPVNEIQGGSINFPVFPVDEIQGESIIFPVFLVYSKRRSFIIDGDGIIYTDIIKFIFRNKLSNLFQPIRDFQVHDFEALFNEVMKHTRGTRDRMTGMIVSQTIYNELGLTSDLSISSLFSIGKMNEDCLKFPVVRVACHGNRGPGKGDLFYVDHVGRVYKNWEDFLSNNVYSKRIICYPRGGTYQVNLQGRVLLDVAKLPAGTSIMPIFDVAGTVAGLGSMAISAGLLGPVCLGFAAGCCIAVGGSQLIDRWKHGQSVVSIGAGRGWLNIVGGLAGVGRVSPALAQGVNAGTKLTKVANTAAKVSKFIDPNVKAAEKFLYAIETARATKKNLKVRKITKEDVDAVFSSIKVNVIKLKNFSIKICDKVKKFFLELWNMYFSVKKHSVVAEGIASTISSSERLETHLGAFKDERDFYCTANFVFEIKGYKLKNMEEQYLEDKKKAQESLGKDFDESDFDKNWGINAGDDRKEVFIKKVDSEISEKEVIELREKYTKEVSMLNESDSVKFSCNEKAVKNYLILHCVKSDVTPKEYFSMIRKVESDPQCKIVNTEEREGGKSTTYYNESIPLRVKISTFGGRTQIDFACFEDFVSEAKNGQV